MFTVKIYLRYKRERWSKICKSANWNRTKRNQMWKDEKKIWLLEELGRKWRVNERTYSATIEHLQKLFIFQISLVSRVTSAHQCQKRTKSCTNQMCTDRKREKEKKKRIMKIGTKNNHGKHLPDINRIKIQFFASLVQLKNAFTKKSTWLHCEYNLKMPHTSKNNRQRKNGNGN